MITQRTPPLIEYKRAQTARQTAINNESDENRLILTLHYNGMITECNKAGGKLLGCLPSELIWQHVSRLLPQLKNVALMEGPNLNPYLHFLSRVGYKFEVISLRGARLIARVFFCEIGDMEHRFLRIIICPLSQERMAS
jgi:PAS domain-containing protein